MDFRSGRINASEERNFDGKLVEVDMEMGPDTPTQPLVMRSNDDVVQSCPTCGFTVVDIIEATELLKARVISSFTHEIEQFQQSLVLSAQNLLAPSDEKFDSTMSETSQPLSGGFSGKNPQNSVEKLEIELEKTQLINRMLVATSKILMNELKV
ncbi:hypothetical protein WR25_06145 [Diploscapter pachys]|uniref:Uncharacterized protein n=1 Tax=Diploscapter pachys TaxID=2018661 RepID=A0A2A2JA46_9BILA|nr:hypothetical protein WR25_06145 [Diploscapter pachys]